MDKVRKNFILFAIIAIFVLLSVLLSLINIIDFAMAAEDADMITQALANENGAFGGRMQITPGSQKAPDLFIPGMTGPDSPELRNSIRYFTVRFNREGKPETVALNVSAFTEAEAAELAEELQKNVKKERTGWVKTAYRYRVYHKDGYAYVTVIDQGRELTPAYRILTVSLIGGAVCLILSFIFLAVIGKKLFKPLENADKKQKRFIVDAEKHFRVPLTVINADLEIMEAENGNSEQTSSIRRQVGKMTTLIKEIGALNILENDGENSEECDLSGCVNAALDAVSRDFEKKGVSLTRVVTGGIKINANPENMRRMADELLKNALAFSSSYTVFELKNEGGHVMIRTVNDTDLPDGEKPEIFDRFTRLENAKDLPGNGLGLAFVKSAVKTVNGRVSASVENNVFSLTVTV